MRRSMTLNVTINGETRSFGAALCVRGLLIALEQDPAKVAVERNLEIVPRSQYGEIIGGGGGRLGMVLFLGGGTAPVESPGNDKPLVIAGKTFKSPLIIGTGKYKS